MLFFFFVFFFASAASGSGSPRPSSSALRLFFFFFFSFIGAGSSSSPSSSDFTARSGSSQPPVVGASSPQPPRSSHPPALAPSGTPPDDDAMISASRPVATALPRFSFELRTSTILTTPERVAFVSPFSSCAVSPRSLPRLTATISSMKLTPSDSFLPSFFGFFRSGSGSGSGSSSPSPSSSSSSSSSPPASLVSMRSQGVFFNADASFFSFSFPPSFSAGFSGSRNPPGPTRLPSMALRLGHIFTRVLA
mmetsp:Transcript_8926/g.36105  ORF Transcript_8926/g.36105 Transcript_8926/m.36105 type:complete len:250 (-) Transcript_8926:868-1617(-)